MMGAHAHEIYATWLREHRMMKFGDYICLLRGVYFEKEQGRISATCYIIAIANLVVSFGHHTWMMGAAFIAHVTNNDTVTIKMLHPAAQKSFTTDAADEYGKPFYLTVQRALLTKKSQASELYNS